jgi:hypothetical protein
MHLPHQAQHSLNKIFMSMLASCQGEFEVVLFLSKMAKYIDCPVAFLTGPFTGFRAVYHITKTWGLGTVNGSYNLESQ